MKTDDRRREGNKKKNEFESSCIHFINPDDLKPPPGAIQCVCVCVSLLTTPGVSINGAKASWMMFAMRQTGDSKPCDPV